MRINRVTKARKDQGGCSFCQKPVTPGMPYKYIEFRFGPRLVRHVDCPDWRPSEMTQSKMSGVFAAQEGYQDDAKDASSIEDLAAALGNAAEQIRSVAEEYEESAQNIEDGFGHETYQSEELREKAEALSGWADDIESKASDLDGTDVVCAECADLEESEHYAHHEFVPTVDHPDTCAVDGCDLPEDAHHEFEEDIDSVRDDADSVMEDMPV